MKRFKDLLLSISILSSIIIVILMILSILTIKTTTEVTLNEQREDKYLVLKQSISDLPEGECKNIITDLSNYIDKGKFEGTVRVKDLFNFLWGFNPLKYYGEIREKCNISDSDLNDRFVSTKYIDNMVLSDAIMDKYMLAYQLKLYDDFDNTINANVDIIAYQAYRANQIEMLSDYLDILYMEDSDE